MFRLFAAALSVPAMALPSFALAAETNAIAQSDGEFAQFAPAEATVATTLDWSAWDQALNWFVLTMGPSLRESAPSVEPEIGTRFTWGHTSRYRMEGNKIAFDILEDKQRESLAAYRMDLQRIGSELDLGSLPRNEQLAFWINLHNVAVIEQLALNYPVTRPSKVQPDGFDMPLDEAKFITVAGVAMSPRDIRTKIVYPNWQDPRVIYGFFHGDIGGPSIAKSAYTGANAATLLADNATEFVNALRGVQKAGETMLVSRLYKEAAPFFFPDFDSDLRAHFSEYAETDVKGILASTSRIDPSIEETDIADLSKGQRQPVYSITQQCARDQTGEFNCSMPNPLVNGAAQRFVEERSVKIRKLVKQGLVGTVIIRQGEEEDEEAGAEVE